MFEGGQIKAADNLVAKNKTSRILRRGTMTAKYPKASLWKMKKVELLIIADSEPTIDANEEMTRAEIIGEILTIESDVVPVTAITESPGQIPPPVPELLEEEEEDDLPPASVRVRRIRKLKE